MEKRAQFGLWPARDPPRKRTGTGSGHHPEEILVLWTRRIFLVVAFKAFLCISPLQSSRSIVSFCLIHAFQDADVEKEARGDPIFGLRHSIVWLSIPTLCISHIRSIRNVQPYRISLKHERLLWDKERCFPGLDLTEFH